MEARIDRKTLIARLQAAASDPPRWPFAAADAEPGGRFLLDRHWHREAHFVLDGVARYRLGGEVLAAGPGIVLPVDRWQEHGIEVSPGNAGCLHVVLHFHDTLWGSVSGMDADGSWTVFEWTWAVVDEDLASFVRRRWDLYEAEEDKSAAFARLLRLPLGSLYQEYARILASRQTPNASTPHDIVDLIVSRIENMRGRDCSLEQIARYAGYSRFRVAHLFKARTGISIGDYINRIRVQYLDQARILDLPSKQIAAELGFQSTTAFYNWRRKARSKRDDDQPAFCASSTSRRTGRGIEI